MLRVILFMIIALFTLFTIDKYISMQESSLTEYNQRLLTITYYKKLFDNIVNSGLFDNLYNYNGFISDGNLYTLNNQSLFPLYVLTYYDEDSYEYTVALNYAVLGTFESTNTVYLDYGNGNLVSLDQTYLNYFQQKMDEFHQATKVNMIITYDVFKVYENTCQSYYKYSFETPYIDKYGFLHFIKVTFC